MTFEHEGVPYRVTEYQHTHMSRGGGTIRVKVRDLASGRLVNLTFKSGDTIQDIDVERRELQYLYGDGEEYFFMDQRSFEQIALPSGVIGQSAPFLKEGDPVWVLFWDEKPLDIDLPASVIMEVEDCDPGEKGNSASNVYKDATLAGGLKVRVPLFINAGDRVKVDTRTGEYLERA